MADSAPDLSEGSRSRLARATSKLGSLTLVSSRDGSELSVSPNSPSATASNRRASAIRSSDAAGVAGVLGHGGKGGDLDSAHLSFAAKRAGQRQLKSIRSRVMLLMDEPTSSRLAMVLHIITLLFICLSIFVVLLLSATTMFDEDEHHEKVLLTLDFTCDLLFTVELVTRVVATADVVMLLTDPFIYFDFASVVPFVVLLFTYGPMQGGEATGVFKERLPVAQVVKLVRILKLARHYEGSRVLWGTLKISFSALLTPLYFLLSMMLLFAAALYLVEANGDAPDNFNNIFKACWFVLVTLTTVGYGDVAPTTAAGQSITSVAIIFGVLFTAMPLTIVGNNFASVWKEKECIRVVLKLQELLVMRKLKPAEVMLVFEEFDLDHNGATSSLPRLRAPCAR